MPAAPEKNPGRDIREALLKVQTEMIYGAVIGTLKLPDHVLAGLISRFRRIAGLLSSAEKTSDEKELMLRLTEMEEYFSEESPLSEPIRKMFTDARPSQVKSVIRGYLVNYVYDW